MRNLTDTKNEWVPRGQAFAWLLVLLIGSMIYMSSAQAEEQDAESKALDSTATQCSFQFAYQMRRHRFADSNLIGCG